MRISLGLEIAGNNSTTSILHLDKVSRITTDRKYSPEYGSDSEYSHFHEVLNKAEAVIEESKQAWKLYVKNLLHQTKTGRVKQLCKPMQQLKKKQKPVQNHKT
jgi:hypothetical protein